MMQQKKKNGLSQKFIGIIAIFIVSFMSQAYAEVPYEKYCNSRFKFCVLYPVTFGMGPAPDNNDGREFYDREGFSMTASGMYNVLENSLKEEMKSQEEDFDTVTYRKVKDHWYVLSGYKDDNILYIKTYMGKETIYHLYIRYPARLKKEYDKIVSKIAKSFKPVSKN